jgi:2-polyprenyl-3-methyl-5-hydroxy-6-metoxy-1,4-benzoquinol methylase
MKYSSEKIYLNEGNKNVEKFISSINNPNAIILDIGIGNGSNARNLKNKYKKIYGITLSKEEAFESKDVYEKIFIHNLEAGLPLELLDIKVDVIICSHVIEHIAYPDKLLNDMSNCLSDSGKTIVCLPNVMHYQSRFKFIFGQFPMADSGIWDYTHLRWYTFSTSNELLSRHFIIDNSIANIVVPFGRFSSKLPKFILDLFSRILLRVSKGFFSHEMVYILKSKNGYK